VGGPSPSCLTTFDYFLAKSMDTLGTVNDMRWAEGYSYQGSWQNSNAMSDERHRVTAGVAASWNCMLMTPSESSSETNGRKGAK
jgi:hypothetical protein